MFLYEMPLTNPGGRTMKKLIYVLAIITSSWIMASCIPPYQCWEFPAAPFCGTDNEGNPTCSRSDLYPYEIPEEQDYCDYHCLCLPKCDLIECPEGEKCYPDADGEPLCADPLDPCLYYECPEGQSCFTDLNGNPYCD